MLFHLFSQEHFAKSSRLPLVELLIWIKYDFDNMSTRLLKRRVGQLGAATTGRKVTEYLQKLGSKDSGKLSS